MRNMKTKELHVTPETMIAAVFEIAPEYAHLARVLF